LLIQANGPGFSIASLCSPGEQRYADAGVDVIQPRVGEAGDAPAQVEEAG
jgi:hypothetical protein